MEILLALAGFVGLAVLFGQQRPLPTPDEAIAALDKLQKNPDDPQANTIVGKFEGFVLGDWKTALPYLVKSGDATLKALAQHELDPNHTETPAQKVSMGDEWILAAKKFPALYRSFFDRGSHWYILAFDKVDLVWKAKLREQALKLAAARPPGSPRKALPTGWTSDSNVAVLDGTISHTGSYSVKLPPADPNKPPGETFLRSAKIKLTGKTVEFSAYVRSEGTTNEMDQFFVNWFNEDGTFIGVNGPPIPIDVPFWSRVSGKMEAPPKAAFVNVGATIRSKKGTAWIDDVSLKIDGTEALKNPSFEER